jgi:hypothetical protein
LTRTIQLRIKVNGDTPSRQLAQPHSADFGYCHWNSDPKQRFAQICLFIDPTLENLNNR